MSFMEKLCLYKDNNHIEIPPFIKTLFEFISYYLKLSNNLLNIKFDKQKMENEQKRSD